jgi:3-oxoacyl-[acyl-carrier-protein] synthase-3
MTYCSISGFSSFLPAKSISNHELPKSLETSDEWIKSRTGISQRYICSDEESTSSLAIGAAREAIKKAGIRSQDVDLIIVATVTPDYFVPGIAHQVQESLNIGKCAAFDIEVACSGFIHSLSIAESFIKTGKSHKALIIAADSLSRLLDWEDRSSCVLFGDGAGAAIVQSQSDASKANLIGTKIQGGGQGVSALRTSEGVGSTGKSSVIKMYNGQSVFVNAVKEMSNISSSLLEDYNFSVEDIDWVVPHQANKNIITEVSKKLKVPLEKTLITIDKFANTSASSIPIALDFGQKENIFSDGDLVLLTAFGAGFSWSSALFKWKQ